MSARKTSSAIFPKLDPTYLKGVCITSGGAILWGASGTSMQYLTTIAALNPAMLTLMRVIVAAAIYLAILFIGYRKQLAAMFKRPRSILYLFIFAFSLYSNQLFYAEAVKATNAGTATVLQMLECVFVLAFVCITNHRFVRLREALGLGLALVATLLIATQGNLTTLALPLGGLIWGLLAALSSSAYILIPDELHLNDKYGSIPVIGVGMAGAILFAVPGYALQGGNVALMVSSLGALSPTEWLIFFFGLVILGTVLGFFAYLYGISLVGSVTGSLLGGIEPVSATVMAALFLGTAFSGFDVLGMILMILMVIFITGKDPEDKGVLS